MQSRQLALPNGFVFPEPIAKFLDEALHALQLPHIPINVRLVDVGDWIRSSKNLSESSFIQSLDMTFVKWNETVGKAYDYTLTSNKMRPSFTIEVHPKKSWKSRVFVLLPDGIRRFIIRKLRPDLLDTPKDSVEGNVNVFDATHELSFVYDKKASLLSDRIVEANNINDAKIVKNMRGGAGKTLLFSGGGLVRERTFAEVEKKFIHMHPGLLPEVRGADCFLWSVLVNGYPSCSAIYQNVGIDTGGVILEESFELPRFNHEFLRSLDGGPESNFYELVYRSILDYFDPMMRAITFAAVLEKVRAGSRVENLELRPQIESEGRNYHFMHAKLRNKLIKLMIKNSSNK